MELSKEKYLNDTYSMPFEGEEHLGTVVELPLELMFGEMTLDQLFGTSCL